MTDSHIATIGRFETGVIEAMASRRVRGLSTVKRNRFVLHLLLLTAQRYLFHLADINRAVDGAEDRLQRSLRNQELLELLRYQKSLVYFTTALKANELMLQRLQRSRMFDAYPDDEDLLEDALTEMQQAIEVVGITGSILAGMMDAFASIISNNLNAVMKFLASVTIVLSFPTILASLYGMNVALPGGDSRHAFAALLGVAVEYLFLRPAKNPSILGLIVITLGAEMLLMGLASWKWGAEQRAFTLPWSYASIYEPLPGIIVSDWAIAVFLTAGVIVALLYVFFRYTRLGIAMRATQQKFFDLAICWAIAFFGWPVTEASWAAASSTSSILEGSAKTESARMLAASFSPLRS